MKRKFRQGLIIVNNFTNINKMNNHFSIQKRTTTCGIRNSVSGLGQAQKCGRVKVVIVTPTLPLLITGSPMTTHIKKKKKNMDRFTSPQKDLMQCTKHKNNGNLVSMDSTIAGSMNACS